MLYVYRLPEKKSNGYCFGGPVPITFGNVDWLGTPEPEVTADELRRFISQKRYFTGAPDGASFLVLCEERPDCTFTMVKGGGRYA